MDSKNISALKKLEAGSAELNNLFELQSVLQWLRNEREDLKRQIQAMRCCGNCLLEKDYGVEGWEVCAFECKKLSHWKSKNGGVPSPELANLPGVEGGF